MLTQRLKQIIPALLIIGAVVFFFVYEDCDRSPDEDNIREAAELVTVRVTPDHKTSFDYMEEGVYQHLDRCYTYDVIPEEMVGGHLFQGIHRPPKGMIVEFELKKPAKVYFFFHYTVDGGYGEIFKTLPEWTLSDTFPQYDIHNGEHGLRMIMYTMDAKPGVYRIPPTLYKRACYNIVFVPQ